MIAHAPHELLGREAFEAWFRQFNADVLHGRPLSAEDMAASRGEFGDYRDFPFLHGCWEGWRALGQQLAQAGVPLGQATVVSVSCAELKEAAEIAGRVCKGPCYHALHEAAEEAIGAEVSIERNPLADGLLHVTAVRQRVAACITALEGGRQDEALLSANMALVSLDRRLASLPSRDGYDDQ